MAKKSKGSSSASKLYKGAFKELKKLVKIYDVTQTIAAVIASGICFKAFDMSLFSWHPICMAGAILVCTVSAIEEIRLKNSVSGSYKKRVGHAKNHVWQNIGSFILLIAGFGCIWQNKENNNKGHFATIHSWLGCLVMLGFSMNVVFGAAKLYGKDRLHWLWKDENHRKSGLISFFCSGLTIVSGLRTMSKSWGELLTTALILSVVGLWALVLYPRGSSASASTVPAAKGPAAKGKK